VGRENISAIYYDRRRKEHMIVAHAKDVEGTVIESAEAKGVMKKVLVSSLQGWEGYVMRSFEVKGGGYTPRHTHPWPHINYITEGKGILFLDGKEYSLKEGSFAYVPGGSEHQFCNREEESFHLLCIVPEEGDQ
jgi:quercetin dioxygenase-like cupin family protein